MGYSRAGLRLAHCSSLRYGSPTFLCKSGGGGLERSTAPYNGSDRVFTCVVGLMSRKLDRMSRKRYLLTSSAPRGQR